MEILVSLEELSRLLSRALNAEVTTVSFIPEDRVIIGTSLDLLGINQPRFSVKEEPREPVRPSLPPVLQSTRESFPEASPEEMEQVMAESQKLEGVVYEYSSDGEVVTRSRNESEANLPPGEPIIYVRRNNE
jgi:hypothetical protein